jgi:hypothetical protein
MSKNLSNSQDDLHAYIEAAVKSGRFPNEEAAYALVLELLQQDARSTDRGAKRQGGQWKGQVTIAPDFDDLPEDLAESFGMK